MIFQWVHQFFIIISLFHVVIILGLMKDLSHGFNDKTINFPGSQKFYFTKQFAREDPFGNWYSDNDFTTGEHCGTHLDAPYHFYIKGKKVGEIPLENLLVQGIFVDATRETANNPNYTLSSNVLVNWERNYGALPNRTVVLISFGWTKKYPNRKEYLGPTDNELRFPGLSKESAEWLVATNKVVGVGVDTPSVDVGVSKNYEVHKILARNDIYGLENVALSKDLPPKFNLIVMPMKITNGTGAPCRIVATTNLC